MTERNTTQGEARLASPPLFMGLQILRGVSVGFTVLAHLPTATAPFTAFGRPAPWLIGVAIFYAISGWIIAHVTRNHTGSDMAAFLTRRLFRIVPVLLATVAVTLGFSILLPHNPMIDQFYPDIWTSLRAGMANLLFVSDLGFMLSVPAPLSLLGLWSIAVEVKFYVIYAALLVLAPGLRPLALAGLLALLLLARARLLLSGSPFGTSHVFFLELFCLGGLSYRFRHLFRYALPLTILAWAWIIAFPILEPQGKAFAAAYAALCASAVYVVNHAAAVTMDARRGPIARALIWLGERSYVLYVFHFQLLAIAGLFAQMAALNFTAPRLYDTVLILGVLLGLPVIEFLHQTVEKGGIRIGARIANGIRP